MTWTSGNENIDDFIQEMPLKINDLNDIVFEWIPYSQFFDIKKNGNTIVYSALWKDGPLQYNSYEMKWTRGQDKKVALECLYNSQNMIDGFLNMV